MDLSPDQERALQEFRSWIDGSNRPTLTLGGYAGTGKTTLIKAIIGQLSRFQTVRVCAFTGKAAYVLTQKGVKATTIHRLIYMPIVVCVATGRPASDCSCLPACKTEVRFQLAPELDAQMIIVDEASMVNRQIYRDLLSFEIPILFVGDHGQLEPIGKNPRLMASPEIRLETIHRQAAMSPIIRFAHHVRLGYLPETCGENARVVESIRVPPDIHTYDAVLCGKNTTRVAVNARIRRELGFEDDLPEPGERVICLRNDHDLSIFNGMQATVVECWRDRDGDGALMTVEDDLGDVFSKMPIAPKQFGAEKTIDKTPRNRTLWDFGYCLTVHKSQGSEWKRVCVLEWIHREWSPARWRYTAATRASEELVYCMHPISAVF